MIEPVLGVSKSIRNDAGAGATGTNAASAAAAPANDRRRRWTATGTDDARISNSPRSDRAFVVTLRRGARRSIHPPATAVACLTRSTQLCTRTHKDETRERLANPTPS